MKFKNYLVLVCLLICQLCTAQIHERWDVKTISDGFIPDTSSVRKITVAQVQPKPKIRVRNTEPRLNMEKQVVRITGTITRIALEGGASGDNDYHIEVTDGTMRDSTLVCEAVDPNDHSAKTSPMNVYFKSVRKVVKNLRVGDKVVFTGILFQDKYHNPSAHRTRNFVEMHPILKARKIG